MLEHRIPRYTEKRLVLNQPDYNNIKSHFKAMSDIPGKVWTYKAKLLL